MEADVVKISVIIPCYNQGHYLRFALDSVLAQRFPHWEAIVVNDGSTDSTTEVVQAYSDPRIRYIYQDNAGLSAARNAGIEASEGRFLAFLDADDAWSPRFLATCLDGLESESALAGIFTRCRYIDSDGTFLPSAGGLAIEPEDFRSKLLQGGFFPPNGILIRASALDKSGLFDTNLTSVEDWDLWLRISQWQSMRGLQQPLAWYRVYPGSMSTHTARMHANRVAVLTKYFGEPDGKLSEWATQKRMSYGFAFQATAFGFFRQGDNDLGRQWLEQAFKVWPPLIERVETYYELACKDQPRGFRGRAEYLNIKDNAVILFTILDMIFPDGGVVKGSQRNIAFGNAYLAVGLLYDQVGDWSLARTYVLRAVSTNRKLLRDSGVRRRLARVLLLNPQFVRGIRPSRGPLKG